MRSRRVLQADLNRSILVAAVKAARNTIPYMSSTMGETAYAMLRQENFKQRVFQIHYAKEKISNTDKAAIGIAAINIYINLRTKMIPIIIFKQFMVLKHLKNTETQTCVAPFYEVIYKEEVIIKVKVG